MKLNYKNVLFAVVYCSLVNMFLFVTGNDATGDHCKSFW